MKKVLSTLLSIAIVFSFIGCSVSDPKSSVSGYFDSFKNGNFEESAKYLKDSTNNEVENDAKEVFSNDDPEVDKAMKKAFGKLNYKILNSTIDGDKAIVETEITAPNLGIIMTELIQEVIPLAFASAFSEKSDDANMDTLMNTMLIDKLNSEDMPMVTKTININLSKDNDLWLIEADDNFIDALTGNMSAVTKMFGD